MRCQKSTSVK
ncbi:Protein of unknown function [Bacillus cereus]|nr:Protein of unknown function [Bacillus cereus]